MISYLLKRPFDIRINKWSIIFLMRMGMDIGFSSTHRPELRRGSAWRVLSRRFRKMVKGFFVG